jgi:hypothetical protein
VIAGFIGYGGGTRLTKTAWGAPVARILIAEDRESMRKALRALFLTRPHSEVCGEAEDWQRGGQESSSIASRLDRYRFMTWTR